MATIAGTSGTVKVNTIEVGKLTSVEITIEQETATQGPYIGDPNTTTVRTGKSASVSGEGVMETPTNAGQQEIMDSIMDETDAAVIIEIGDPAEQTFTCAAMIITSMPLGLDSGEGAPFSFEMISNGSFTLVAAT